MFLALHNGLGKSFDIIGGQNQMVLAKVRFPTIIVRSTTNLVQGTARWTNLTATCTVLFETQQPPPDAITLLLGKSK